MAAVTSDLPPEAAGQGVVARSSLLRVALLIVLTVSINILTGTFTGEKLSFLYKDALGLTPGAFASLGILIGIPAYLRPVFGSVSDLVPLFGYHRRSYFALAALLVAGGFFALSLLPHYTYGLTAGLVMVTLTGGIVLMVIADAVMVRVGNATGLVGRLQTIQQFMAPVLSILFAANLGGYVTQHWSYHACFRTAALLGLCALPLALLIDERRIGAGEATTGEAVAARREERRREHARTMAALKNGARQPGLWVVVLFVFYLILTPGTNTAQFFYMVDRLHFSKQFLGHLGAFGAAGTIVGVLSYAWFSPRLPGRLLTWGVILLDCLIYALYWGLHSQVSAEVLYAIGGMTGIWYTLGLLTIAARACPPGIEAAVYGLVLSAMNLGGTLGEKIGSTLYDRFRAGGHADQSWHMLLVIGFLFSALAAVFLPFLPTWARSPLTLKAQREAGAV